MALPANVLLKVFTKLDLCTLSQISCTSKQLCVLSKQAFKLIYSIWHKGKLHLDYTKIFRKHDMLLKAAKSQNRDADMATILKGCWGYKYIRFVVRVKFGCYIDSFTGSLENVHMEDIPLDILNDESKISVLPYFLEHHGADFRWIYFMHGLAELGRHDLLSQMTFSKISQPLFYKLLSVSVPEDVLTTAARSLQEHEYRGKLPGLLAFAGLGFRSMPVPASSTVPLFILRFLRTKAISFPEYWRFTDGMEESSIPFWMYVCKARVREATGLIQDVLELGDERSKLLAMAFYGPVVNDGLSCMENDVYQAAIVRFRFSSICNEHVEQNYSAVIAKLTAVEYHTACALLDCKQYELIERCSLNSLHSDALEAVIDKMQRLEDETLYRAIRCGLERSICAPDLLKNLIKRKANDAYVQLVWDAIQTAPFFHSMYSHSCFAPLSTLKKLAFARELSVCDAESMLCGLDGLLEKAYPAFRKNYAVYVLLFWEAPENVIDYFIDKIQVGDELITSLFYRLPRLVQYSEGLRSKFIARLGGGRYSMQEIL